MTTRLQLSEMITNLRAEVGHSLVAAHGVNLEDTLKYTLQRVQRELYLSHDWPELTADEKVAFTADNRYLTNPTYINYTRINRMWCAEGTEWCPMEHGIDPAHYSLYKSETPAVTSFPILRYKYDPIQDAIELWPVPSQNGNVLVRGTKKLDVLVDSADTSTLDGDLIVLYAAADVLAHQRSEDAALKLQKAQSYLASMRRNQGSQKRGPIALNPATGGRRPRPGIDFIPRSS